MHIPIPIRRAGQSLSSNSPTILSAVAIVGVVATAVLAVRATPTALIKHAEAEAEKNTWTLAQAADRGESVKVDDYIPLTPVEIVKATWKSYIPAVVAGSATIACIVGSNQIGLRRNAALLGAYTLVDGAFRQYKDEVLAQIGAVKEGKVTDEISRKELERNPAPSSEVIIIGGGDQLCYESLTGRYFKSDIEKIRRAENDFNRGIVRNTMYASLNEWFELLDLDHAIVGDELGFNIDIPVELVFKSHLAEDGRTCLYLHYAYFPIKDYGKL